MSRVIAYKTKAGKFNYFVIGDDPTENILVQCTQGFERKAGLENNLIEVVRAITSREPYALAPVEYWTHAQYQAWRREHRNMQARNRRARGKK